MLDLRAIKERHPSEHINALGSQDLKDVRALIAEVERLRSERLSLLTILRCGKGAIDKLADLASEWDQLDTTDHDGHET